MKTLATAFIMHMVLNDTRGGSWCTHLFALQRLARGPRRKVVLADDHLLVQVVEDLVGQRE
eukprot:7378518-Prymnesium_polylepis.1